MQRPSGRANHEMRKVTIETNVSKHAEGSCMVKFGDTHVLCTASVDTGVPRWMKGTGKGWVTAEYGMLPRSTNTRIDREAAKGKQTGRTQEIQRLIARSLRAVVDFQAMGECQIKVDCDVIQADGGTRTASITGGFVAMYMAFQHMVKLGIITDVPVIDTVSAISCGIYEGQAVSDLDYIEDSNADTDANFVITGKQGICEIQGTAEAAPFSEKEFMALFALAKQSCAELCDIQKSVLGI